ncbi:MAG: long-chain fatty acid--CoA ligase [Bacteroidetes bacterium]|nr:long-chain fatty acid--CoA ligase [Bacteroidota bacterium]
MHAVPIRTQWLERWAQYTPNKIAVKDDASGEQFSYASMYRQTNRISRVLREQYGIGPGDRVAVLSTNCVEYLFLYFAVQQLGAILVPVNFRLSPREIAYILKDCSASLLVVQQQFGPVAAALPEDSRPSRMVGIQAGPDANIRSLMTDPSVPDAPVGAAAGFEDPCMILYTSGTTGNPKGAIITNAMVFWNSINTELRLNITSNDTTLAFAPFFHTGGWHVLTTPFLHHGATVVLMNSFQAERVVELCDREQVSILFGVPTMMRMMGETAAFSAATFASVRFAIVGGEPMPIPEIERWQAKGVPIRQGFGMTEVGPNCFSLPEEDAIRKKGSIGFPNFYIDVRVVDDAGRDVGTDEPGELLLRSPVVTLGYWNNPQATQEAITDGWFHTGDIVRKDAEGYFYVVDRKKDMFISGAENVYPAEIEKFLYTHPSVAEAAVVGVPDATWGEVGRAFIVPKPGAELTGAMLREFCTGNLAKYKVPKYFTLLSELPKGHSGKVLKRALKELHHSP